MYSKIVRDLLFMGMLQEWEKATEGNFLVLFVHFFWVLGVVWFGFLLGVFVFFLNMETCC